MKKQTYKLILKIFGSVIFLLFLITRIDWDAAKFLTIFSNLKLGWFLISLSGVIVVLGLKSARWNLLLRSEGCVYPFTSAFIAYMSSFTIGLLTPGRIGEIARLYYVREEKDIDFFHSFKTIVTDRIFDFALLIWFGTSGLMFFYKILGGLSSPFYLLLVGVLILISWIAGKFILRLIRSKSSIFVFIKEAWSEMFDKKMFTPWVLTLLSYLLFYVANWFILLSIDQEISIIEVGFILSLMSLVTLIPITIAGFGTREASLIYLFAFYGLSPETAIVFSLLQFLAFFLWGGIIGLVFWMSKPVKLSLIKADASKVINLLKPKNGRNKEVENFTESR